MKKTSFILNRLLIIIIAIQTLNLSFNNLNNFFIEESDNSISYHNQIDSAFEYVTEHLLGWDNYVPENKSQTDHQSNHQIHKTGNWSNISLVNSHMIPKKLYQISKHFPFVISTTLTGFKMEVNPPPPKC